MADNNLYIANRKRFARPQAMLWSANPGKLSNGLYSPDGYEVGTNPAQMSIQDPDLVDQFLVISDHGRNPLDFKPTRIEKRERMINGRMRSHHIADKLTITTSWSNLPSRSYASFPDFDPSTGKSALAVAGNSAAEYTADGGAGAVDILNWYENHQGSFWVYLAYDRFDNFQGQANQYSRLNQYNQIIEMYISDISYNVNTRSQGLGDLWNVSVTLEEA